jgi:hypothetical protein
VSVFPTPLAPQELQRALEVAFLDFLFPDRRRAEPPQELCATDRFLRREAERTGRPLAELEAEIPAALLEGVRALHAFETLQHANPLAAGDALRRARTKRRP